MKNNSTDMIYDTFLKLLQRLLCQFALMNMWIISVQIVFTYDLLNSMVFTHDTAPHT